MGFGLDGAGELLCTLDNNNNSNNGLRKKLSGNGNYKNGSYDFSNSNNNGSNIDPTEIQHNAVSHSQYYM